MTSATFERSSVRNIRVHVLPTDRFKTYSIAVYIGAPLAETTVTPTALIPFVLRRGTESLPETKRFREKLDELYGAGFGFDVYKLGDRQIVQFRLEMIDDRFVRSPEPLLKAALHVLGEAIARPALQDGAFVSRYVEAEKETLEKKIAEIVNDKIRYAYERCIAEMCKDEPYRLHPLGSAEQIADITPASLYGHYRSWLAQCPIDLYVVGNTTPAEVEELVDAAFPLERPASVRYGRPAEPRTVVREQTVVEELEVNQGKLNLGLRLPVTYADEAYPAALMYNGILGAFPHSKLFLNVREKASLAYYASSRYEGHKGILTVQSGIETANFEKALAIIKEQLNAMARGEISDFEMEQTKAMIANQLRQTGDSAFGLIAFDFNGVLSGTERSAAELISRVEAVDREMVMKTAERVQLDTVYFLRGTAEIDRRKEASNR